MFTRLKRLLNGIEQASILGLRCQSLEKENVDLKSRNTALWESYNKAHDEAIALKEKFSEVNEKLRIQTEADLVLTSLKIIQGAMRGETKTALSGLAFMQEQQMAMLQRQGMAGSTNYYGGSLGGTLGLGL